MSRCNNAESTFCLEGIKVEETTLETVVHVILTKKKSRELRAEQGRAEVKYDQTGLVRQSACLSVRAKRVCLCRWRAQRTFVLCQSTEKCRVGPGRVLESGFLEMDILPSKEGWSEVG